MHDILKNHTAFLVLPVPDPVDANYSDLMICQKALTHFSVHNLIDYVILLFWDTKGEKGYSM